jgi:molybdopterin-guanine dinucleotide biosynthesis protein A
MTTADYAPAMNPGEPLGVVLAGGRSSRMGTPKASVELGGAPLIERPLLAMRDARMEAVVVAKPGTQLPPLEVPVWQEPEEPAHPLTGIVAALEQGGRPVVVCGCDLPFLPPALLAHLAGRCEPLVVLDAAGRLHPLVGRYTPALVDALRTGRDEQRPMHEVVTELGAVRITEPKLQRYGDPDRIVFNVNTPADLARAQELLRRPRS